MKISKLFIFIIVFSGIASVAFTDVYADMKQRVEQQQQSPDRHTWDFRRDAPRKPLKTFKFLGLKPGMTVMDVGAAAGYTTEMLAAAVGPEGRVYSHNRERVLYVYADGYYKRTMDERLAGNRLPNVVLHVKEYDDLGLDEELDLAFWGNNFHDYHYHEEGEATALEVLISIKKALKPGGILGITDHVGTADHDNRELHRIEPDILRDTLEQAGFIIEEESDLFANPADDHSLGSLRRRDLPEDRPGSYPGQKTISRVWLKSRTSWGSQRASSASCTRASTYME